MGLSRRNVLMIVGASFGLGAATAGHQVIRTRLGQATNALSSLESSGQPEEVSAATNVEAVDDPVLPHPDEPVLRTNSSNPAPEGMVAPQRGDVRLIVMSDINGPYRSTTYHPEVMRSIQLIPAWEPDLVLCVGDMVGGRLLSLNTAEIQAMWGGFDRHVFQSIRQAGLPFAVAMGARDASNLVSDGMYVFAQEREAAWDYWTAAERDLGIDFVDRTGFPFYYSFIQNDIFYLVWDASSADIAAEELIWVEESLASPRAQQARMRISLGHFPLYAVAQGRDRPNEYLNRGDELRDLLERYNVHTHIAGHHHAYYPGHVGDLELLYSGALGAGPRAWLGTDDENPIRTLTVMDIFFNAAPTFAPETANANSGGLGEPEPITTIYTTYNMSTGEVVDQTELPRVIAGPTGLVLRQDVERRDLTYEDNRRYVRRWQY